MQILLLAPSQRSISGCGVRALSAYARRRGHEVTLAFLPADVRMCRDEEGFLLADYSYPDALTRQILELCGSADLVGLSLFTCFFEVSCQLTRAIKTAFPEKPVIWGGVHPTVNPRECLLHADFVCVGEGEDPLVELAEALEGGGDTRGIRNIWSSVDGEVVETPSRAAELSMNALPAPDMDLDRHFTRDLRTGRLAPLTLERFRASMHRVRASRGRALRSLVVLGSRGCHLKCSYCVNSHYHDVYGASWAVNRLDTDRLVDQIAEWVERFPFAEEIELADDDFAARPRREMERFCATYPERVGRPFHYLSTPALIRPERVLPLKEAGCFYFQMGIQSASREALERYDRPDERAQIREAAELLASVSGDIMPPCYHVILDDPFEPPAESLETLRFVNQLPRPFWLKRSALVPFPGTPIRRRALEAGLLDPETEPARLYRRVLTAPRPTPINLIWRALSDGAPPELIDSLARSALLREGHPAYEAAARLGPALDQGMARLQQGRRWWSLGRAALSRGDLRYLAERLISVSTGPAKVPTSQPPG